MDIVTYRAEQALLGALLTAGSSSAPGPVGPGDFGDSRHQALYAAITGTGPQPRGPLGRFRAWLTGLPWRRQVRDMRAYMAQLPGACPDAGHLEQYAAIVHEASGERGVAADTGEEPGDLDRLAGAAVWLARQTQQAAARPRPGRTAPPVAAEPAAVPPAQGPARQVTAGVSGAMHETARRNVQAVVRGQREAAPVVAGQVVGRGDGVERRPLRVEDLQELVLADLLRRPADARHVIGWLPAQAFTAGTPRAAYDLIRSLIGDGKPADPVIVAWEVRRARADGSDPSGLPDPDEILRIGALEPAPGSAAIIGRALLADQLCTRRFGKDWPALPLLTQPLTVPQARRADQPQPGQAPAPEPGHHAEPQPDAALVTAAPPAPAPAATANGVQQPPVVPTATGPVPGL